MDLTVQRTGIVIVLLFSVPIGLLASLYSEFVPGFALGLFWGFVFIRALYHTVWRPVFDRWLLRVLVFGFLIRLPMVLAHLAIGLLFYSGAIDFTGYFAHGVDLGRGLLGGSFGRMFTFGRENYLESTSGGLVVNRLMALGYLMVGPSLVGFFLLSGMIGFMGSYLFLRAFQVQFPSCREIRFLALCLFFFPSLAFWTSLLGKDSWMFFFLGCATYSVSRMTKPFPARYWLVLTLSVAFVFLIRPPIGVALVAAAASFFALSFPSRLPVRGPAAILRPVAYMSCIVVAVGCAAILGLGLRQYLGSFAEGSSMVDALVRFAVYRHMGYSTDPNAGGSSLAIAIREPTLSGVIQYLPLGITTFLFRPFLNEARNLRELVAAFDATMLLVLVIWRWRNLLAAIRSALSKPFVAFCVTAFILITVALSFEANFGVIVRHRTMVLGFLLILLAHPRSQVRHAGRSSSPVITS